MRNIILLGMKHSGKSALGKLLASERGMAFVDTDDLVAQSVGEQVRDYYKHFGPNAFMEAEALVCKKLFEEGTKNCVIATGGGVCMNEGALEALRKLGVLVYLNVEQKVCYSRILEEDTLPAYLQGVANPEKVFEKFFLERTAKYKKLCDIEVILNPNATKEENSKLLGRVV